jgi:hypothetical protein
MNGKYVGKSAGRGRSPLSEAEPAAAVGCGAATRASSAAASGRERGSRWHIFSTTSRQRCWSRAPGVPLDTCSAGSPASNAAKHPLDASSAARGSYSASARYRRRDGRSKIASPSRTISAMTQPCSKTQVVNWACPKASSPTSREKCTHRCKDAHLLCQAPSPRLTHRCKDVHLLCQAPSPRWGRRRAPADKRGLGKRNF